MVHGDEIFPAGDEYMMRAWRRRLAVDVLLCASTGKAHLISEPSGLVINPGSITGAKVHPQSTGQPSYSLLILDKGKVCTLHLHLHAHAARPWCTSVAFTRTTRGGR